MTKDFFNPPLKVEIHQNQFPYTLFYLKKIISVVFEKLLKIKSQILIKMTVLR